MSIFASNIVNEIDRLPEHRVYGRVCAITGLLVEIARPIAEIHYSYVVRSHNIRVAKVVHHFLMEPRGGDVADHDHEYDVAAWVEAQDAMRRLTYDNERDMLRLALEFLESDPGQGDGSREAAG